MREQGGEHWKNWTARCERQLLITLAGPLAELRYVHGRAPAGVIDGKAPDVDALNTWCRAMGFEYDGFAAGVYNSDVKKMLREPGTWAAVVAVASLLRGRGSVSAEEFEVACLGLKVPRISAKLAHGESMSEVCI
jgi:hypothetical protein